MAFSHVVVGHCAELVLTLEAMRRLLTVVAVLLLAAPSVAQAAADIPPSAQLPAPAPTIADAVAARAPHFLGVPYVWAGTTTSGFDCSGFTRFMYAQFGITLDHSTYAQWDAAATSQKRICNPAISCFSAWVTSGSTSVTASSSTPPHRHGGADVDSLDSGWYGHVQAVGYAARRLAATESNHTSRASAHHGHNQAAGGPKDKELVQRAPREPTV